MSCDTPGSFENQTFHAPFPSSAIDISNTGLYYLSQMGLRASLPTDSTVGEE